MNSLIILAALGLIILFSEIFNFKKIIFPIVFAGIIAAIVAALGDWNNSASYFNNMIRTDNYAVSFSVLILFITLLWFVMSSSMFEDQETRTDYFSLIVFSLIGALVMVSFTNLIMLFLGIEILSISMYALAGSKKDNLASNEAAMKYFLLGAFTTGFLLFGIALVYGITGSFNTDQISEYIMSTGHSSSPVLIAGILLILTALTFKIAAAPFHFWAPDVYQGAPTPVTAFMSSVVKTAAIASFLRLFGSAFAGPSEFWIATLWVISAITIVLGNILAVYQTNLKRMLAYSSISHAGYMIMSVIALNEKAASSLLFYTAAYGISSLPAFMVLLIVSSKSGTEEISGLRGMFSKNPIMASAACIAVLSLAGIPPLAGFFAKYYIFSAALQSGYTGLVLIAVAGSLVGVFYYFRIIINIFESNVQMNDLGVNVFNKAFLLICSLLALLFGILPGLIIDAI